MFKGKTIMVVEDEALIALDLAMTMEDLGASVAGPCFRVQTALRMAESTRIDAAILDVDLNGESVTPLARFLQKRGIPFVFHTGRVHPHQLLQLFADAKICMKPSRTEELTCCLQDVLKASIASPTNLQVRSPRLH